MAITNRSVLKDSFQKGDKPRQQDFENLIDSFLHLKDNTDSPLILSSISASDSGLVINSASFGQIYGNLTVSGNIVPIVDSNSITSSFSLGSETQVWKDLYVSEDSIKFMRKNPDDFQNPTLLAKISIEKETGPFGESKGTDDVIKLRKADGNHMDMETRQLQIGKSRAKGWTMNDGEGHTSVDVYGKFQQYMGDGKGQQMLMRPEYEAMSLFGRKFKTHTFNAQGAGSATMALYNLDGDKNGFFRVEKGSSLAGVGTPLFEIHEGKQHTFYGTDSVVKVEGTVESTGGTFTGGNTTIENAVISQPGVISQSITIGSSTEPATHTMEGVGTDYRIKIADNQYKQISTITFISSTSYINTSSLQDATLPASGAFYFAKQNGDFFTFTFNTPEQEIANTDISGSIFEQNVSSIVNGAYQSSGSSGKSTGINLANLISNVIDNQSGFSTVIEGNKVIVTNDNPGRAVDASTSFPATTASISTTVPGGGVIIRINEGSTLKIISPQPTIVANSSEGTVVLSDPDILGGGDITINPDNGGNPTVLSQNVTIPANQVSYWTVGSHIPGTYLENTPDLGPTGGTNTGIQIGANLSVLHDGIFINGEEITPAFYVHNNSPYNIKLRIEEGAQLHIVSETNVLSTDEGTIITGTTVLDVTSTDNSVDITGVDGSDTLNVQGGNAYYDVSQMSMDITQGGFFGIGVSGSTYAQNLANINMLLTVEGGVVEQYSNDIVITSSVLLSQQKHGNGKVLHVNSGSGLTLQEANPENTYSTVHGMYPSELYNRPGNLRSVLGGGTSGSWGVLEISLPSAVIGTSFHIRNAVPTSAGFSGVHTCSVHDTTNQNPLIPEIILSSPYPSLMGTPSIKISPSGSNKFHFGATGAPGVAGKAVTFTSQSMHGGNFIKLYCISQSHWMIQEVGGDLVDEA